MNNNNIDPSKQIWWSYLEHDIRELLNESVVLLAEVQKWKKKFHDYSFVIFPAAKAYEGFLKYLFLDMGLITKREFEGKQFRIGKALNPTLYRSMMRKQDHYKDLRRKISIYDKLIVYCGGTGLADYLWETWTECRNLTFHWFPNEKNVVTYDEAKLKVELIFNAMNLAFKECKINDNSDE